MHVLWRLVPLSFSRFGRWRCRLDFGSVFYSMSSSSFASVRRLVLFRVRQNQVTKNLFSNSSAGLAIISAQFRNIYFDGVFSFRFRLIVLRVLRFSAHSFLNRSISVSRESEWVFFYMLHFGFHSFFFWFSFISINFVVFENHQRNEKDALCVRVVEFLAFLHQLCFFFLRLFGYKMCVNINPSMHRGVLLVPVSRLFFFECCKFLKKLCNS